MVEGEADTLYSCSWVLSWSYSTLRIWAIPSELSQLNPRGPSLRILHPQSLATGSDQGKKQLWASYNRCSQQSEKGYHHTLCNGVEKMQEEATLTEVTSRRAIELFSPVKCMWKWCSSLLRGWLRSRCAFLHWSGEIMLSQETTPKSQWFHPVKVYFLLTECPLYIQIFLQSSWFPSVDSGIWSPSILRHLSMGDPYSSWKRDGRIGRYVGFSSSPGSDTHYFCSHFNGQSWSYQRHVKVRDTKV